MKKWSIKYLLFSLIVLFGINLYSDKVYAATSWCPSTSPACATMGPVQLGVENNSSTVSIQDTISCTYKINSKSNTEGKAPNTIAIVRKLEATNLKKDTSYIEYEINDYYNGTKLSKITNYGDDNYYKKTFDCPNSFAFYDDTFNQNGKTKVYFSKSQDGSSSWTYYKTISVYSIDSKKASGSTIKTIAEKSCSFTNQTNDNQTINIYTEFDNNDLKMHIRYSGYVSNTSNKWTILNKKNIDTIKSAFNSGSCDADILNYLYYNRKKSGLAFLETGNLNNNQNDFDGSDGDYDVFVNSSGRELRQKSIDRASETWEDAKSDYDKYCDESSSSYNDEKCSEATEVLKEAASNIKVKCNNVSRVSDEYKDICTDLSTDVTETSDEIGVDLSALPEITCETLGALRDKLQTYFTLIKVLTPVLIIGLGILDFIQAMASSDDDALKKAGNKFVKRLIIGVVIILLPYLIDIVLQLITDYQTSTCDIR